MKNVTLHLFETNRIGEVQTQCHMYTCKWAYILQCMSKNG